MASEQELEGVVGARPTVAGVRETIRRNGEELARTTDPALRAEIEEDTAYARRLLARLEGGAS